MTVALTTQTLTVRPLSDVMGAEAIGVDLSRPLDDATFRAIHRAFLDAGVLVLRDQKLTPAQHVAFSRRFGELSIHVKDEFLYPGIPEILILSNRKHPDGQPMGFEDAGRYWHTDMSYVEEPPLGSLLHAVEIPPEGGDTIFCNMYLAYDALPDAMKARIAGLRGVHSFVASFEGKTKAGASRGTLSAEQKAKLTDAVHPMVRTHPETGRKALYVNPGFTYKVEGMAEAEGQVLLEELFAHSTQPRFQYRHVWKSHDLVFWDNRCAMHHATTYDPRHIRHMQRTTVKGDRPV